MEVVQAEEKTQQLPQHEFREKAQRPMNFRHLATVHRRAEQLTDLCYCSREILLLVNRGQSTLSSSVDGPVGAVHDILQFFLPVPQLIHAVDDVVALDLQNQKRGLHDTGVDPFKNMGD